MYFLVTVIFKALRKFAIKSTEYHFVALIVIYVLLNFLRYSCVRIRGDMPVYNRSSTVLKHNKL